MTMPFILHYADQYQIYASDGCYIYNLKCGEIAMKKLARLPVSKWKQLQAAHRLTRRFFRSGIHYIIPKEKNRIIIFAFRDVFEMDIRTKRIKKLAKVHGSRPLNVWSDESGLYYGEYHSNKNRQPVSVWFSENGYDWKSVISLNGVRHIHGVYRDPFTKEYWITTGDTNDESAIWNVGSCFKYAEPILSGSQQARAVGLLFEKEYIYFGTDTPLEQSCIYRMGKNGKSLQELAKVDGPVGYAKKIGKWMFFSTFSEPSKVYDGKYCSLWVGSDCCAFKKILSIKKDGHNRTAFGFGRLTFAHGDGEGESLWVNPIGLEVDQCAFRLDLNKLFELRKRSL